MHTDEALWHERDGAPGEHRRRLRSTPSSTHGAGAFQLFDSWAGALSRGRLRARSCCPTRAAVFAELAARHPDAPGIHFGIGCDHLLESMHAAGPTRDRASTGARRSPTPAARLGADLVVQGNLDPALVLAGARRRARRHRRRARRQRRRTPATSSTSATACTRTPIPACCGAIVDARARARRRDDGVTRRSACSLMAYGTPRHARRDRAVLHRHPPRPAADAPSSSPTSPAGTPRSAASRRWPSAPRPSATRSLQAALDERGARAVRRRARDASTPHPTIEAAVDAARRAGRRPDRRPGARPALLGDLGRRVPRAGGAARPRRAASASSGSRAGRPSRRSSTSSPRRVRDAAGDAAGEHQGGVHRPLAARSGSSTPATRTRDELRATARPSRSPPVSVAGAGGRSAWQSPAAPPSRGSGPTSSRSSTTSAPAEHADGLLVCPCGFVADHLEVLYDLDIEARQRAEAAGLAFARTAVRQRRPRRDGALAAASIAAT